MRFPLLLLLLVACQNTPKNEPAPADSAAPAPSAFPSSPAAPGAEKPWFEGSWQGSFDAALFRMELPAGGVKEWKNDDGKSGSGPGQLSFDASPDGTVHGGAQGALGELLVAGRIDGERAALSLSPATPGGFQGVLLAERAGDALKGTLRASSGDSLQVRRAEVTLSRARK